MIKRYMFKKQIPVKQAGCLKGAFHEIIRKHNILKSNKIITTCILNNKLYIS